MKKLLFIIGVVLAIVGCENKGRSINDSNVYFVAGNTYEKIYYDNGSLLVWELVFTNDSLHSYWAGDLEVIASYTQNGANIECMSSNGHTFYIVAGDGYVIYSDNTFMMRK